MSDQSGLTASHDAPAVPAVICSWCKTYLEDGSFPPSHGDCLDCLETRLNIPRNLIELTPPEREEPAA